MCCADEVAQYAAPQAPTKCRNSGIKNPGSRRLYDDCVDCGKNGKVGTNGKLRAHAPQS